MICCNAPNVLNIKQCKLPYTKLKVQHDQDIGKCQIDSDFIAVLFHDVCMREKCPHVVVE